MNKKILKRDWVAILLGVNRTREKTIWWHPLVILFLVIQFFIDVGKGIYLGIKNYIEIYKDTDWTYKY